MFKDAFIIFRKELKNFFKDQRTIISTFLLPALLLPVLFIGMGTVMHAMESKAQQTTFTVALEGNHDPRLTTLMADKLSYTLGEPQEAEIVITFPPHYLAGTRAQVLVTYDSSSSKIEYASQRLVGALQEYNTLLADNLLSLYGLAGDDLQSLDIRLIDIAPSAVQSGGAVLALLVPYFLIIFLFSGSMNAGLDTTSGEKERGSLAVLLVNQVSRTAIAWGKILFVSVISLCAAMATFVGLLITLLFSLDGMSLTGASTSAYVMSGSSLVALVLLLITTALFAAAVVTVVGCFAKTVKEGSSYIIPLYMVVVLAGVTTMYMDPSELIALYLIPIVNTIFVMKESFMGMVNPLHLVVTILSNLCFAYVGALVVARLFNSERIVQTV
ncbi:MAG: ABC transporter permease subunit [Sphaerochaetaceae bacterium]|jgi:sodium transport system permease protein|nr:ABC transporter permease subunit [Sphaerochaetaceae bacterium]